MGETLLGLEKSVNPRDHLIASPQYHREGRAEVRREGHQSITEESGLLDERIADGKSDRLDPLIHRGD